jgi:hypothetical protein
MVGCGRGGELDGEARQVERHRFRQHLLHVLLCQHMIMCLPKGGRHDGRCLYVHGKLNNLAEQGPSAFKADSCAPWHRLSTCKIGHAMFASEEMSLVKRNTSMCILLATSI